MHSLMQTDTGANASAGGIAVIVVVMLAIGLFYVACMWKIFVKAGEPGWYAVIPILNTYTLIKISGRPGWWLLLMLIPCISFVIAIIVMIDLASAFGKSSGFGLGLAFLGFIFLPILAFGDAQYGRAPAYTAGGYLPYSPQAQLPSSTWGQAGPQYGQASGYQPSGYQPSGYQQPGQPSDPQPPVATSPPSGWYPDPSGIGQRWWDGNAWTEHTSP
jgi:hypothetical protein